MCSVNLDLNLFTEWDFFYYFILATIRQPSHYHLVIDK